MVGAKNVGSLGQDCIPWFLSLEQDAFIVSNFVYKVKLKREL